jgi:hypothetical protein
VRADHAKGKKMKDLKCEQVGSEVSLLGGKPFWSSFYNVYFDSDFVGLCEQNSDVCEIIFSDLP